MMKSKAVPSEFWGEAVTTAVYVLNGSPTKSLEGVTPYEAWHGKKPSVGHPRVFGSVGHVKNNGLGVKKLSDRSVKMVLLGYAEGTKAIGCMILSQRSCTLVEMLSLKRTKAGTRTMEVTVKTDLNSSLLIFSLLVPNRQQKLVMAVHSLRHLNQHHYHLHRCVQCLGAPRDQQHIVHRPHLQLELSG